MVVSDEQTLLASAIAVLKDAGYTELETPFQVGNLELDIASVFEGPQGTLSLAVVGERPENREAASKTYWTLQRLVRALDASGSRRSVTAVLVGSRAGETTLTSELQSVARDLTVDGTLPVTRSLAPLLRIMPPSSISVSSSGTSRLQKATAGRDESKLRAIINSASRGARAVEEVVVGWLDEALSSPEDGDR
jgi:hypothetical protein